MNTRRAIGLVLAVAALGFTCGRWLTLDAADRWVANQLPPTAPNSGEVLMVGFDKAYVDHPASRPGLTDHTHAVQELDRLGARVIMLADGLRLHATPGRAHDFADAIAQAGNVVAGNVSSGGITDRKFVQAAWFTPSYLTDSGASRGHLSLVTDHEGILYPSAPLAAILLAQQVKPRIRLGHDFVRFGQHTVPVDRKTRELYTYPDGEIKADVFQMRIATSPSLVIGDTSAYVSAARLLDATLTRQRVTGRIVVVGAVPDDGSRYQYYGGVWTDSALQDTANAVNTILTDHYIQPVSAPAGGALAALLGVLGLFGSSRRRLWTGPLVAVAGTAAYASVVYAAWTRGWVLPAVTPLAALWLVALGGLTVRLILLARQRRRSADALSRYVPGPVARDLMRANRREGRDARMVTFLFTDVVDSTRGWNLAPEEMEASLKRHDEIVADIVAKHGGFQVLPRSEGDSRFVVFSDPVGGAHAALELHRELSNEPWAIPFPLQIRAALHTDQIDAQQAAFYGTPVNRCTAIRSMADAGQTFVSEGTAAQIRDVPGLALHHKGDLEIPGAAADLPVYELTATLATVER